MVSSSCLQVQELERRIHARTNRQVRDLAIELKPERIVIRGHASTYYVKQLAQHGAREALPNILLENAIEVNSSRDGRGV